MLMESEVMKERLANLIEKFEDIAGKLNALCMICRDQELRLVRLEIEQSRYSNNWERIADMAFKVIGTVTAALVLWKLGRP